MKIAESRIPAPRATAAASEPEKAAQDASSVPEGIRLVPDESSRVASPKKLGTYRCERGAIGAPPPDVVGKWKEQAILALARLVYENHSSGGKPTFRQRLDAEVEKAIAGVDAEFAPGIAQKAELEFRKDHAQELEAGGIALYPAVAARPNALDEAVTAFRARAEALPDFFSPLGSELVGHGRGKKGFETVLATSKDFMVIVDGGTGGPRPKALVVPKRNPINFATDLSAEESTQMIALAAKVSDAILTVALKDSRFKSKASAQLADLYFHPPDHTGIAQLHVHTEPRLGSWREAAAGEWEAAFESAMKELPTTDDKGEPIPEKILERAAAQHAEQAIEPIKIEFYDKVIRKLAKS